MVLWISFKFIDKIKEIIEVDKHVSSRIIVLELKIDRKTVRIKLNSKRSLMFGVPHQKTRIFICEALHEKNEIDPFLKRMVTGYEKWVTCVCVKTIPRNFGSLAGKF